jgi:hypothetical protein
MSEEIPQQELLDEMARLFKRFEKDGDLSPEEDRDSWDKLVESKPPEERELIEELARFADMWRYFQGHEQKLGPEIVKAISELHKLPVAQRTARLKEINLKLLERISDADQGTQSRH